MGRAASSPSARRKRLGRSGRGNLLHHRVAHVARADAVSPVELLLEREDAQHPVHVAGDLPDAALPPGPDGGAHVEHHRDAEPAELAREPQVEVRHVHQESGRGPSLARGAHQGPETRQMRGSRGKTSTMPMTEISLASNSRSSPAACEARAAHPEGAEVRPAAAELGQHVRGVKVARGFARHHHQLAVRHGRSKAGWYTSGPW